MLILTPTSFSVASATASGATLDWARSGNGQQLAEHGTCAASLLPADDDVVLVLPPHAVSWHRATLPRVANAKLRAVLDGVLEEHLLSDSADLHFALEPGGRAGQTVWVAACHKTWLKAWLQVLEDAGHPVSRIVPSIWPHLASARHPSAATVHWAHHQAGRPWLASASALGVVCTPLQPGSTGVAALVTPTPGDAETPDGAIQWLAEPAAAAEAEQLLGQRFELVALPAWLLRCAQSEWNLAQFDLSLSSTARRGQRLRQTRRLPARRMQHHARVHLASREQLQLHVAGGLDQLQRHLRPLLAEGPHPIRSPEDLCHHMLIHSEVCLVSWRDWMRQHRKVPLANFLGFPPVGCSAKYYYNPSSYCTGNSLVVTGNASSTSNHWRLEGMAVYCRP